MNNSPKLCVSVDIGCRQHSVAIGLPNGYVLDEFDIHHRSEGFKQFFERIEHQCQQHGNEVAVAMEGYNGYARPLACIIISLKQETVLSRSSLIISKCFIIELGDMPVLQSKTIRCIILVTNPSPL